MSKLIPWGVAHTFYAVLVDAASDDLRANPTIAAGDFKISLDDGAFTNLTTLPSVDPASGVQVKISLSAAEAQFTRAVITAIDTATKEWKDNAWALHTPRAEGALCGAITSGTPSTTSFISSHLTGANTDQYKDAYVTFLTGTCAGATKKITAFNAGTDAVTCDALPAAPSVGDVFAIINGV
jgi:hypothetical protein